MPPIEYIAQSAEQAAYVPPQATSADVVLLLPRNLHLAPTVVGPMTVGVCYSSWAVAEAELPTLDPSVELVCWGIEYNNPAEPLPPDEAANIPLWLTKAAADCAVYGKQFGVVPDNYYARQYAFEIAQSAAIWFEQIQRYQDNLPRVKRTLLAITQDAGAGGGDLFVQTWPGNATTGGVQAAMGAWTAASAVPGVTGCGFYNSGSDGDWTAIQAAIAVLRPS